MAIEGYIGRRGKGKTYTVVCRVLKRHHRYACIASNIRIEVPNLLLIEGPEDVLPGGKLDEVLAAFSLSGFLRSVGGRGRWGFGRRRWRPPSWSVLVVLDEAQNWFPSRNSAKLPPSIVWLLSQTRKLDWDILWTSQQAGRVDKVVRDNTDWIWKCDRWFSFLTLTGRPLFYTARAWEPEHLQSQKKKDRGPWVFRFFRWEVARAYDTKGTVAVADHVAAIDDYYTKKNAARAS